MLKKDFTLLTIVLLISICITNVSCTKDCNCGSTSSNVVTPIGTTVKLEATIATGTQIPSVQYYDAQQNAVSKLNVANNWTYTYQTTKDNQYIMLQLNGAASNVTGKIFINGVLKKDATGTLITIVYP